MTPGENGIRNIKLLTWFIGAAAAAVLVIMLTYTPANAEVQATWTYQTNASMAPITGYNMYRNGQDPWFIDINTVTATQVTDPSTNELVDGETGPVECLDIPAGQADYTLSAVHEDGYESPQSVPYPFDMPVCELIKLLILETNEN